MTATTSRDTCKYFFRNKDFQYLPVTQWSRQLVIAYCDCLWRSTIPWETGILHIFITGGVTRHPRLVMAAMMLQ